MNIFLTLLSTAALLDGFANAQDSLTREKRPSVDLDETERGERETNDGKSYSFPIILPPYNYEKLDQKNFGTCLLYIEAISVVVYTRKEQVNNDFGFSSAAVIINGTGDGSTFSFSSDYVNCMDKKNGTINKNFDFRLKIDVTKELVAKDKDGRNLFSINKDLDFIMRFKVNNDSSWQLWDIELQKEININKEDWLKKDFVVAKTESDNANRIYFGGFNDYNYACSSTPAVAWTPKKKGKEGGDSDTPTVGIVFNNLQLQAFGAQRKSYKEDAPKEDRPIYVFNINVNDCEGSFSVGSWMGIIVLLVLLAVLAFGFLMLNSVQTMDRFDDPKQKQLLINAKE